MTTQLAKIRERDALYDSVDGLIVHSMAAMAIYKDDADSRELGQQDRRWLLQRVTDVKTLLESEGHGADYETCDCERPRCPMCKWLAALTEEAEDSRAG